MQLLTPTLLKIFSDRLTFTKDLGLPDSIQPVQKDWAPRVGFAWTPFGGTNFVVRSGFGIFYAFPDSNTINNTVATVPFIASTTVVNDRPPLAPTRTWGDLLSWPAERGGQYKWSCLSFRVCGTVVRDTECRFGRRRI